MTNKPEEEGAKIRKLPRFDPSFPFPYFSTVPQTSFWSSSLISLFSDESETAVRNGDAKGSEVSAVRPATVLCGAEGLFSRSLGHGQAEGERERERGRNVC